jgi:hypothetical protein
VKQWSAEGCRRKIRGKQRQQQPPPSRVISNAPRASPSFSPSLTLSLSLSLALTRARAILSRTCRAHLASLRSFVWGKPNRQNAIFVRF